MPTIPNSLEYGLPFTVSHNFGLRPPPQTVGGIPHCRKAHFPRYPRGGPGGRGGGSGEFLASQIKCKLLLGQHFVLRGAPLGLKKKRPPPSTLFGSIPVRHPESRPQMIFENQAPSCQNLATALGGGKVPHPPSTLGAPEVVTAPPSPLKG